LLKARLWARLLDGAAVHRCDHPLVFEIGFSHRGQLQRPRSPMQRVDAPEILDSDTCSAGEVHAVLKVLSRVNRWFGGVSTTQKMVERVAQASGIRHFSVLEVAAGSGEVPQLVRQTLAQDGITIEVTLLDRASNHLPENCPGKDRIQKNQSIVGDALALPFADGAFDLVSCNLFAHHLDRQQLAQFAREGLRVSRRALLINDLVRNPLHLALAFAGFPLMLNRVAWLDGLTSVRRAYLPDEMRSMITSALAPTAAQIEISRHYLFRMGVMVWKSPAAPGKPHPSGRPALREYYRAPEKT
jgi:ubiquinone/menaquinone biosynthesis C-methylase UbiE